MQGMELAKNLYKLKEKDQGYILLARGRMGTPGCVNKKEPEERKFVVDFGAGMHMVSKRDLNSAWRP